MTIAQGRTEDWQARLRKEWMVLLPGGLLVFAAALFTVLNLLGLLAQLPLPDLPAVSPVSVFSYLLSGLILLLPGWHRRRWIEHSQVLLAVLLLLLSAYSWTVYLGLWSLAIEPTYSAPNTALGFALGAAAIIWLRVSSMHAPIYVALIALAMCVLAALGFVGLVLRFDPLFGWSTAVHMSGYTASALLLFAVGLAVIAWHREQEQPHTATQRILLLVAGVLTITVIMGALIVYVVAVTHLQWHAGERVMLVLNEKVDHLQLLLERGMKQHQVLAAQLQGARTPEEARKLLLKADGFRYVAVRGHEQVLVQGTSLELGQVGLPLPIATAPASLLYWQNEEFVLRTRRPINGWTLTTEQTVPFERVIGQHEGLSPGGLMHICAPIAALPAGNLRCVPLDDKARLASHATSAELVSRVMQLALAGEKGRGVFNDMGRREVIIAYASWAGLGLAIEQDAAELYASLHRDLRLTMPFLLVLLLASGLMIIWRLMPLAQALRMSEQRFRDLVESSNDWIWEVNAQGVYTYASPTIKGLLGYEPQEVVGKTPFDLMQPDEAQRVGVQFRLIASSAKPFHGLENINRHKNGRLVVLETNGVPFFDAQGELAGYRGMDRDITGRKEIEQRLARSEEHYRLLAENANDMISLHDLDGLYRYVSPACRKLLGYEPPDMLGRDAYEFIHPDDHFLVRQSHMSVLGAADRYRTVYRIRRKDNSYVWFETISNVIHHGGLAPDEILAVSRDVTTSRHNEEALRSSEQLYRSVITALAEGVVVHDSGGRIISANDAACAILGRSREYMLGYGSSAISWNVIREDGQEYKAEDQPAMVTLRTGVPQRGLIMGVMRGDGSRVWISVNTEPLPGSAGNGLAGVVASFADVTDRRKAEQALLVSRERLRALSIHLQQLQEQERAVLARELHDELGSTMTALRMDVAWMQSKVADGATELGTKLHYMSQLLDGGVRTLRRIVTELRPTVLDDLGLWAALDWQLDEFARYSGIKVARDIRCTDVSISPDMGLAVFRIVQEALTNVAKHAQASEVRIDFWIDNERLHMLVEDNGVGLTEANTNDVTAHGIRGMEERVMQFQGGMEFHGGEGEGTLIYMWMPLQ